MEKATESKNFVVTGLTDWTGGGIRVMNYITPSLEEAKKAVMDSVALIAKSVVEHGEQPAGSEFGGRWLGDNVFEFGFVDRKTEEPLTGGLLAQFHIGKALEYGFSK